MVYPALLTLMPHTSAACSRLNWSPPADLNGLVRFSRKTKFVSRACAITFQLASVARCIFCYILKYSHASFNLLTPNVNYSGRTASLTSKVAFYIFIQQIYVLNILNMVYNLLFFSSKCSLFHNSNVFGSCIIHILYTVCAKIKKVIPAPNV